MLVQEMRRIESTLPRGSHVAAPIENLHQQLLVKEEECRQKDEALRGKDEIIQSKVEVVAGKDKALWHLDEVIRKNDEALKEKEEEFKLKEEVIKEKDDIIRKKDAVIREKDGKIREKDIVIRNMQADNQQLRSWSNSISDFRQPFEAKQARSRQSVKVVEEQSTTLQAKIQQSMRVQSAALVRKVRHPVRDWRKLGMFQRIIQHSPGGGLYGGVAVNSSGLLAVTDNTNRCVHIVTKEGALVRSNGEGMLSGNLYGAAFDLKGNIWVCDMENSKVLILSQDGRLLQDIRRVGDGYFKCPSGISVSPDGLIYICDCGNPRVTVHDEEGMFQFTFGLRGSGPGCFGRPRDIAFGSDGLVYVTDEGNKRVCVWSKEGTFHKDFKPKHAPWCIAATSDNHLLITSIISNTVMVYTLDGQPVHEFGGKGSSLGRFEGPRGICVDNDGLVYVADYCNRRVQV